MNKEELSQKIMDLIQDTDISYFECLGILEGIKSTLFLEHMGTSMPEIIALWKEQRENE